MKLENEHLPIGKFALGGRRGFGPGSGAKPAAVRNFVVLRTRKDLRSAWLRWTPLAGACADNMYFDLAPDRRYSCIRAHLANDYPFDGMDKDRPYYFTTEALNENGVSARPPVILAR